MKRTLIAKIVGNLISFLNSIAGSEHLTESIVNAIIGETFSNEVT